MRKKILIPTDFSENANNAINYAADLFKNKECDFYILHAYKNKVPSRSELMTLKPDNLSFESEKIKSEEGLGKVLEMIKFRDKNKIHDYYVTSIQDDPLNAIKSIVAKRDIELVVMGTKGARNYRGSLFGSKTINVMENLRNCPIIGVPMDARVVDIKEIVFPTNFKTHYKRRELIHLVELAQIQKANICVLHISEQQELEMEQQENKQLLEECLTGASFSLHQVGGSDATTGVKRFVESRGSDMVAFINSKHAFFGSIFTTPMIKELGLFSRVPLFVMHDILH